MILIGDPGQLPPVADKPSYHSNPSGETENKVTKHIECLIKLLNLLSINEYRVNHVNKKNSEIYSRDFEKVNPT